MTHELSLIQNLLTKIDALSKEQGAERVTGVKVRLGALSHISADHFREHFVEGVKGSIAEGASLVIEESEDMNDPQAQSILLQSIEVE